METQTEIILSITDAALVKLAQTAAREGVNVVDSFLRVAVVPGGCSGLTYDLGWDTLKSDVDKSFKIANFTLIVDPRSAAYLQGTTLDFSEGLEGKGFYFDNPQAVRNCACGESFGL